MNAPSEFLDYGPDAVLMAGLNQVHRLWVGEDVKTVGRNGVRHDRADGLRRHRRFGHSLSSGDARREGAAVAAGSVAS